MKLERVGYRTRQFWAAVRAIPEPADIELAGQYLNAEQMVLFLSMQPSEQAHSLQVFKQLCRQVCELPEQQKKQYQDLLVAGLLHDVGKSRQPLYLWERVLIVLVRAIFPHKVQQWGQPKDIAGVKPGEKAAGLGWRRPFIIAEQHPRWGAELAANAGVSPLAVSLILHHQQKIIAPPATLEERFLYQLQSVDSTL